MNPREFEEMAGFVTHIATQQQGAKLQIALSRVPPVICIR